MLLIVAATEPELRGAADLPGVDTFACGIGPVDAAAHVATRLAEQPRPEAILHVGIAGARRAAGIAPGDMVIGTASVYCDTTSRLIDNRLLPDSDLLSQLEAAFPQARLLEIGTSAEVGGGAHDVEIEAMEGFAVLRAAELVVIPAVEVRVVSNEIEESDRARWHIDLALANLSSALPGLVAALVR